MYIKFKFGVMRSFLWAVLPNSDLRLGVVGCRLVLELGGAVLACLLRETEGVGL